MKTEFLSVKTAGGHLAQKDFVLYKNLPLQYNGNAAQSSKTEVQILQSRLTDQAVKHVKRLKKAIVVAQEEERTRIGNELHDNVNQLLASSKLFLGMIIPKDEKSQNLKSMVKEYIETACNEIRALSHGLSVADFADTCVINSIKKSVDDLSQSGAFSISFQHESAIENLGEEQKMALLRIFQEQVKNIINHSRATSIDIGLNVCGGDEVILVIKDNGVGFNTAARRQGIGLTNMYRRAELSNGYLSIKSSVGNGCELTLFLPLQKNNIEAYREGAKHRLKIDS